MVHRHLLDSLSVLPWVHGRRLLDVGSGGGLPGMVIGLARPELRCTLLDSAAKKTRFLLQATAALRVHNVEVVRERVQDYRPPRLYSTVVSRAFASLESLWTMTAPLLELEGRLLAMKGRFPSAELRALECERCRVEVEPLAVPVLGERHLVIVQRAPAPRSND